MSRERFVSILRLAAMVLFVGFWAPGARADGGMSFEEARARLEKANGTFERGDFAAALDAYETIARSGHGTAAVLGNAGAAAFRLGDTGKAVLYYRRALRIDPGYDRAVRSLRIIAPTSAAEAPSFLSVLVEGLFTRTSPVFWVVVMDAFLLAGSFLLWRGMTSPDPDRRGHFLSLAVYAGVFVLVAGGTAFANESWRRGGQEAVVLRDKTSGLSAPTPTSQELLVLPAGTTVTLTEEPSGGYVRFKLPDGSAAYIATSAIERV